MIYLAPIGFDPSHIIAGIVEEGISEDDRVVLITPEANLEEQRFREARQEVDSFLETVGKATIETLTVDHTAFEESIITIARFIEEQDEPITLNASQAAREILLATVVAAMIQREEIESVTVFSDVDRQNIEADLPFSVSITENQEAVLAELTEEMKLSELAETLGIDKSTASRRINKMRDDHLIEEMTIVDGAKAEKEKG